jgi:mono/diheme cytochrome c family protein
VKLRKTEVWVGAGALAVVAAVAVALAAGAFDTSATAKPSFLERTLAPWVVDRSVARRAPKGPNPIPVTPELLARGLAEYREHCVVCHGAPGEPQSGIAAGLNPSAPDLADPESQEGSDGELFQFISAGVRMTGMPAFSRSEKAETIWMLVAFVRHLPKLSDEERRALKTRPGPRTEGEPTRQR